MLKLWKKPEINDLDIKMTELSPLKGDNVDAEYKDINGNLWTSYS